MTGTLSTYISTLMHIYDNVSLSSSCNEKCFKQKLYVKSKHTCHVAEIYFENRVVYEIM